MYGILKYSILLRAFVVTTSLLATVNCSQTRKFAFSMCANRQDTTKTPLHVISVRSQVDCATACAKKDQCRSAILTKNGTTRQCALRSDWMNDLDCDRLIMNVNAYVINMKNPCHYNGYFEVSRLCRCPPGYFGDFCENPPKDCYSNTRMHITIYPYGDLEAVTVTCESNGHIVVFRFTSVYGFPGRNDTWEVYKNSFGNYENGYWAGNQVLHRLTNSGRYVMYMYVVTNSGLPTALFYDDFVVDNEANSYSIHFTGYNKTGPGDNILVDGTPFSTADNDITNCVADYGAAYWYPDCLTPSPLLGFYPEGGTEKSIISIQAELIRLG